MPVAGLLLVRHTQRTNKHYFIHNTYTFLILFFLLLLLFCKNNHNKFQYQQRTPTRFRINQNVSIYTCYFIDIRRGTHVLLSRGSKMHGRWFVAWMNMIGVSWVSLKSWIWTNFASGIARESWMWNRNWHELWFWFINHKCLWNGYISDWDMVEFVQWQVLIYFKHVLISAIEKKKKNTEVYSWAEKWN